MLSWRATLSLFLVIFLEGYVVLSAELLAIRQTIPFIGSGSDTVAIIIAAVLLPLAFGYHTGGNFKTGKGNSVRSKLIDNMIIALLFLLIGQSYVLIDLFFDTLLSNGINDRHVMAALYAGIFLIVPVYTLGQTIPLISNYFRHEALSKVTGNILLCSTLGSFMGAVFSTIVLMATIGVHSTAALLFVILPALIILLSKNKLSNRVLGVVGMGFFGIAINSHTIINKLNIIESNPYNTVAIIETKNNERHLYLNGSASSMYSDQGDKYAYIEFMEEQGLKPLLKDDRVHNILVIGAGGFSFGHEDKKNHYDFVDIDKNLKDISEKYILKEPIPDNQVFHPLPARAYLAQTDKKYDLIILDAFSGYYTMPEHLTTQEFFVKIRNALKQNGVVMANLIVSPNFTDIYSRNIDQTFRSAFPYISRYVLHGTYSLHNKNKRLLANVIYMSTNHEPSNNERIYTDNKNTIAHDRP